MSALGFTDQRARLRRILENSLQGAAYDSSETEEDGRMVVLRARRPDGGRVAVRFRAVSRSDASEAPQPGSTMRLRSIDVRDTGCLTGLLGVIAIALPRLGSPAPGSARVRIEAGSARLDIVCEDAEWWEETGSA